MRSFKADSLTWSRSWMSMARLAFPSRLELNRPEGSFNAAPWKCSHAATETSTVSKARCRLYSTCYTENGASDAAVFAGKAEPTDQN